VWQAHPAGCLVHAVFGCQALGDRGVVTTSNTDPAAAAAAASVRGSSTARLWLLPPVGRRATAADTAADTAAKLNGAVPGSQGLQPLLLAEAVSPVKALITAAPQLLPQHQQQQQQQQQQQ
jgi:hypothetical protein